MSGKKDKQKLKIYRFDPHQRTKDGKLVHNLYNKIIVVIGPRGAGKSFLIRDLMTLIHKIPVGKIISGTEESNHYYGQFNPDIFIEDEYTEEMIEDFVDRQKDITKKVNEDPKYKKVDNRALLLLDDCLWDDSWTKHKLMRFIFMNGRWWGITAIFGLQEPLGLPRGLRGNIDYVFICNNGNPREREVIYKNYISGFKNRKEFDKVMDSCTQDYNVLVIKKTSNSSKLKDTVFWYKARERLGFKFGSPLVWKYHGEKYDKHYQVRKEAIERKKKKEEKEKRRNKGRKTAAPKITADQLEVTRIDHAERL